jgi:hypothetical protein
MNALRSSECAGYSLKSYGKNIDTVSPDVFLRVKIHTLVLTWNDESLHVVLRLLQQLP